MASTNDREREIFDTELVELGSEQTSARKAGSTPLVGPEDDAEPTLSVVLPTLNEQEGIADCIEQIRATISHLGIRTEIIVSDGSTDWTPEIASALGGKVVHPDRAGYGYAYRYAFERARGEYVVMGDADCTYDFAELPKLLAAMIERDADIVMGSRLEGEIESGAMPPLHRYVGNPLLTRFLNTFYGTSVSDAHSGFRVFRRDVFEKLKLETDGMEFASEMIMEAGAKGLTIEEVPIRYRERKGEATLKSFEDGWRHVRFMLLNAPGYLFSIPGTVIGVVGVLIMALSYFGVSLDGWSIGIHSMIAGCVLTMVGYQVGSFGVFATLTSDPIRTPENSPTEWVVDHLRLKHGLLVGGALFTAGAGYAAYLFGSWVTTGGSNLPLLNEDILALSALVLGLQTVFTAFFLSYLQST
jgi:glycosyltransferase involved in cell wall biosynthesis